MNNSADPMLARVILKEELERIQVRVALGLRIQALTRTQAIWDPSGSSITPLSGAFLLRTRVSSLCTDAEQAQLIDEINSALSEQDPEVREYNSMLEAEEEGLQAAIADYESSNRGCHGEPEPMTDI